MWECLGIPRHIHCSCSMVMAQVHNVMHIQTCLYVPFGQRIFHIIVINIGCHVQYASQKSKQCYHTLPYRYLIATLGYPTLLLPFPTLLLLYATLPLLHSYLSVPYRYPTFTSTAILPLLYCTLRDSLYMYIENAQRQCNDGGTSVTILWWHTHSIASQFLSTV